MSGRVILIAEDDPSVARLLRLALAPRGVVVVDTVAGLRREAERAWGFVLDIWLTALRDRTDLVIGSGATTRGTATITVPRSGPDLTGLLVRVRFPGWFHPLTAVAYGLTARPG